MSGSRPPLSFITSVLLSTSTTGVSAVLHHVERVPVLDAHDRVGESTT